jgi:Putative auto-transporter adhesin, head GIN domain
MSARGMLVTLVIVALGLSACTVTIGPSNRVTGSGTVTSKNAEAGTCTKIRADSGFKVIVTGGAASQVAIKADDNVLPYAKAVCEGDTLRIFVDAARITAHELQATVTLPELRRVILDGGSQLEMSSLPSTPRFDAEVNAGARLTGSLQATDAVLSVNGGGQLTLSGAVGSLTLKGNGGAQSDLKELTAQKATVNLDGGAGATITVQSSLDYDLSGGAQLRYYGSPTIGRARATGGAAARKQ